MCLCWGDLSWCSGVRCVCDCKISPSPQDPPWTRCVMGFAVKQPDHQAAPAPSPHRHTPHRTPSAYVRTHTQTHTHTDAHTHTHTHTPHVTTLNPQVLGTLIQFDGLFRRTITGSGRADGSQRRPLPGSRPSLPGSRPSLPGSRPSLPGSPRRPLPGSRRNRGAAAPRPVRPDRLIDLGYRPRRYLR